MGKFIRIGREKRAMDKVAKLRALFFLRAWSGTLLPTLSQQSIVRTSQCLDFSLSGAGINKLPFPPVFAGEKLLKTALWEELQWIWFFWLAQLGPSEAIVSYKRYFLPMPNWCISPWEHWIIMPKFLNVYNFGMKMYTSQPITALLEKSSAVIGRE